MQTRAFQTNPPDLLQGVSVADRANPILTLHQLGGIGRVENKALVIPGHVGGHIHSIEYVSVQPLSSVGEHQQQTDEIYYLVEGSGELCTNGMTSRVSAGDLVIAPCGTRHSMRNFQIDPLTFFVIEVNVPPEPVYSPGVKEALPALLRSDSEAYPAWVGKQRVALHIARLDLRAFFAGPWGWLTLMEVPPGCRLEPYSIEGFDENVFVLEGHANIALNGHEPFLTDEDAIHGLNVFIPAQLSRQITNRSSVEPLSVLSVQICHV